MPSIACITRNGADADHACGELVLGYRAGKGWAASRGCPEKTSGRRRWRNSAAVSKKALARRCISGTSPHLAKAATISPFSTGHTEPQWYEKGLNDGWFEERVRMPHPEN